MFRKIRQLFCIHDYRVIDFNRNTFHTTFVCMKCDKIKEEFY